MPTVKLPPTRAKLAKTNGNGVSKDDFKVRDLSLADWGRKTIHVSEHEMPGLMAVFSTTTSMNTVPSAVICGVTSSFRTAS